MVLLIENGQKEGNIAEAVTVPIVSGIKSTLMTLTFKNRASYI